MVNKVSQRNLWETSTPEVGCADKDETALAVLALVVTVVR